MKAPGRVEVLATLLELQERARHIKSEPELMFLIVNEMHRLVPYRQAILFSPAGKVMAASAVDSVEANAPFIQWLQKAFRKPLRACRHPQSLGPGDFTKQVRKNWSDYLPSGACLLPVLAPNGVRYGTLLLVRDGDWNAGQLALADNLLGAMAHAWSALSGPRRKRLSGWLKAATGLAVAAAVAWALTLPVPISVLAPAEIVALRPVVIKSPMDGVIDSLSVTPNQTVRAGELLFQLDPRRLTSELEVARALLDSMVAEYRQTNRKALADPQSQQRLTVLAGRAEEQKSRIQQLEKRIARAAHRAPAGGTVVFRNASDWAGRPVQVGERVMTLVDTDRLEAEILVSVDDAIDLPLGAAIDLYLNSDPLHPVTARLRYFSYEAQTQPNGTLVHRVLATLDSGHPLPRLGTRGTARLKGESVSVAYWLFRRPLAAVRQLIGQ